MLPQNETAGIAGITRIKRTTIIADHARALKNRPVKCKPREKEKPKVKEKPKARPKEVPEHHAHENLGPGVKGNGTVR